VSGIIQKLFGHPRPTKEVQSSSPAPESGDSGDVDTGPLAPPLPALKRSASGSANTIPIQTTRLTAASLQSVGMQRTNNEDALFSLTASLAGNGIEAPFGLYIVADGMGGHRHGEIASELAVRAMSSYITRKLYLPLLGPPSTPPEESILEILGGGVQEAHQAVLRDAAGGGTTLTAALVLGEQVSIAHVGDSRAYLINSQGEISAVTNDHSLVNRLVEIGQISAEEAALHPQRNVLYRALGQGEPFEADVITFALPHKGWLLLCSDGLWGVVGEKELTRLTSQAASLEQACQNLIQAANNAGGPDNITAILVRFPA
jgi:serine/threonine protein phosphatase PrpC